MNEQEYLPETDDLPYTPPEVLRVMNYYAEKLGEVDYKIERVTMDDLALRKARQDGAKDLIKHLEDNNRVIEQQQLGDPNITLAGT